MSHRPFKDRLYGEFAIIGKALASPLRLELLDLLVRVNGRWTSCREIDQSLANTSAHV